MKKENLVQIIETIKKESVPFVPKDIYQKNNLNFSYKTFFRGIIKLIELNCLEGKKVSHGRGKGINYEIVFIDRDRLGEVKNGINR